MLRRLRSEGSTAASPDSENSTIRNNNNIPSSYSARQQNNSNSNKLASRQNPNTSSSSKSIMLSSSRMQKPHNSADQKHHQKEDSSKDNGDNNNNLQFLKNIRDQTAMVISSSSGSSSSSSPLPQPIYNELQLIASTIVRCDDRIQMSKTWERRLDALLRAKELFLQNPKIASCSNFVSTLSQLKDGLNFQLLDIRSQIAKEACNTVDAMISCAAGALNACEIVVDWFLGTLFQLASNTAAVVSTTASECVKKICIRGRINRDGMSTIYKYCNDKHSQTRTEAYDALLMILHFSNDKSLFLKQVTSISLSLRNGLKDKLPAVRLRSRVACWALDAVSHEAAVNLLNGCEVSLKKSVLDEEPTYALWVSQGIQIFGFSCEDAVAARKEGLTPTSLQMMAGGGGASTSSHPLLLKKTNSNLNNNTLLKNRSQQQQQQSHQQQDAALPNDSIVSNYMSVFGSPSMTHHQQQQQAKNNNQDAAAAVGNDENNNDDNSNWLLQSPKNNSSTSNNANNKNPQKQKSSKTLQQQQQSSSSESKWTELSLDYLDSDWKHRVEVLGQIETVILGEDKPAKLMNNAGTNSNNQVKIELPGSGTHIVEPGGSLLPLAEVLYDANSTSRGVKTLRPLDGQYQDDADEVLQNKNASSSPNSARFHNNNNNKSSFFHHQLPPPQLSSLPLFFRNDSSNVKPEEVVDLVLKGVEDVNPKVCLAGLASLCRLVERSPVMLATSLEKTFKILFQKLGDMKENIRSRAVEVLTLMRRRIQAERIVPVLLGKILDLVQHRIRLACLEYLHSGIPFFDSFFQSSNHMRSSLSRIVSLSQKVHNLDINHATVACMARLAERYRELFVTSLMMMDQKDKNKIVSALSTAVPYLTQDLRRKALREPLLMQSSPDTSLNYSLFLAPGENATKGSKPTSSSCGLQQQQQQDAAATASTAVRGGQVPTRLSQRMQERGQRQSTNHHEDPTMMLNDDAAASSSTTSPLTKKRSTSRRSLSPRQKSSKSYFERKQQQFASELLHDADGNQKQQQQNQQQENNNNNNNKSWFVQHKTNPPMSAVQQWAANRQDPPAIVSLASAVTSDDKLKGLSDLENADASVWLDNFSRVAPFPIALCSDETDHRVRAAALRCTKLVMTAPALVSTQHHHSDGGVLEAAVRAAAKCLDDPFPEVRSEAIDCLTSAFSFDHLHSRHSHQQKKQSSSFGHALLSAVLTVALEQTNAKTSINVRQTAGSALKFLLTHLTKIYFRGLSSSSSSSSVSSPSLLLTMDGAPSSRYSSSSTTTTRPLLPQVCKFLISTFSHDNPDVRKLVVQCFVELLVQHNNENEEEELLRNFVGLGSAQMRLIDIYWNRALDITNPVERRDLTKKMREYGFLKSAY